MKTSIFILLAVFISFVSCDTPAENKQVENTVSRMDTSTLDSQSATNQSAPNQNDEPLNKTPKGLKPVFGYRFKLSGDFDGDGKKEQLTEHYFSGLNHKETNKYYEDLSDYDQLVNLTVKKKPYSFVVSDNKRIDTLFISYANQLLGLSYLKNEGDLNGDGTDELSYVINWADWSNVNTWYLVTYKNNQWTELYSFSIMDWQLPDLPQTFNEYGVFGIDNKVVNTTNDSVNKQLEKELLNFKGLVRKVKNKKIQIAYINEEGSDATKVVDLNRVK